jgi:hypothetical protein
VDELTIAWELGRIQSDTTQHTISVDPTKYLDRLSALPVEPGTALELSRGIAAHEQRAAHHHDQAEQAAQLVQHGMHEQRAIGRAIGHDSDVGIRPPTYDPPAHLIERNGPSPTF